MAWNEKQIDNYLSGKMDESTLTQFKRDLANDQDLADEVKEHELAVHVVIAINDRSLRAQVQRIHQKEKRLPKKDRRIWFWTALAAAAACFVFILYPSQKKSPTPDDLFFTYYTTSKVSFGSRDANGNKQLIEAGSAFTKGEFSEALPLFHNALSSQPDHPKILLAIASCHLELDQPDLAISYLNKIIDQRNPLYHEEATWYKLMTYLKLNNSDEAIVVAQSIMEKANGWNREKALRILETLEQ